VSGPSHSEVLRLLVVYLTELLFSGMPMGEWAASLPPPWLLT
jgi:hypothetical protein